MKNQAYVITCECVSRSCISLTILSRSPGVEGNPYLLSGSNRDEPALKRALSVRGLVKSNGLSKRVSHCIYVPTSISWTLHCNVHTCYCTF